MNRLSKEREKEIRDSIDSKLWVSDDDYIQQIGYRIDLLDEIDALREEISKLKPPGLKNELQKDDFMKKLHYSYDGEEVWVNLNKIFLMEPEKFDADYKYTVGTYICLETGAQLRVKETVQEILRLINQ